MPAWREPLLRVGLVLASTVLGLALLETVLVLADARPASTVHLSDRRVTTGLDCYPSNPRGYFDLDLRDETTLERFRARHIRKVDEKVAATPYAVELSYNAQNFRDADFGPRRPGRRRVIVLGDSFTEGQGVKANDVLPRVLERRLNQTEPGRWEVLNAGRRGADFPALRENLEAVLAYDPDLVVYAMMLNDPEVTDEFRARHAFVYDRVARGWDSGSREEARRFRVSAFVASRLDERRVERATTRWYRDLYGPANREGWARTQAEIVDMDRRLRERGARLLVVTWPVLAGLEGDYPFAAVHETIAGFCRRAGIAHQDLLHTFRGRSSRGLWVHEVDRHPNETAHQLAAESVAPAVRRVMAVRY
jgi:lysophospholipase L1-like esterase